jgi:thiol-disulfide isomerase/thioredoxin
MQIFYFTADWCNPCKQIRPIVDEMIRDGLSTKIQLIDVDSEIELVNKYNVSSVPTFIKIDDDGMEKNRISGKKTKIELEEFINNG